MAGPDDPVAARGIVAAQIYQGGHVDLYVDAQDVASGRLLLRLAAKENMSLLAGRHAHRHDVLRRSGDTVQTGDEPLRLG